MSWKRRTCTNTGNVPVSSLLLELKHKSREAPRLVHLSSRELLWLSSESFIFYGQILYVVNQYLSVRPLISHDQVHEAWKRDHNDQANIWQGTQPPVQWVPSIFPRSKAAGTWRWSLTYPAPTLKKEYSYTSTLLLGLHGLLQGEFTFPYHSTCVCRRASHVALLKKVRFGETSAKLETFKNAARIDGIICIRVY